MRQYVACVIISVNDFIYRCSYSLLLLISEGLE